MELVGGFNPIEKYEKNWIISPKIGVKINAATNHQPPPNNPREVFGSHDFSFGSHDLWVSQVNFFRGNSHQATEHMLHLSDLSNQSTLVCSTEFDLIVKKILGIRH